MNNENTDNNRAYPCDEPEGKRSYPCDSDGEAFSYAGNADAGNASDAADSVKKGKGKRGGNASASVVVHSGKPKTGIFKSAKYGRHSTDSADDNGSRESRRSYNSDGEEHRSGENRDGGHRSYDRSRSEDRDGNRRSFGDRRNDDRRGSFGDRRSDERRNGRDDRSRRDGGYGKRDNDRRDDRRNDDRRNDGRRYDDRRRDDRRGDSRDGRYDDRRGNSNGRRGTRELSPESLFSKSYPSKIVKTSDVGAFVQAPEEIAHSAYRSKVAESGLVLLPFAEQIGRPSSGTEVKVYFYEDKGGRLAATMRAPILRDGEVGVLTVAAVTSIGAFLDNGVPKQVLLPFKEQIVSPEVGDEVLVYIYSDKSGRQAATMRVYTHLDKNSPYHEDDRVTGFVYEINPELGIFIAVDNKYYGLVPIRETFKEYEYGDEIEARVAKVREDGKLDLLIREKLYKTVQEDAEVILYELKRSNGFLPYGDRADAQFIEETYAMSKNQFKRALGHLYKNHRVELDRENDTVRLLK